VPAVPHGADSVPPPSASTKERCVALLQLPVCGPSGERTHTRARTLQRAQRPPLRVKPFNRQPIYTHRTRRTRRTRRSFVPQALPPTSPLGRAYY
jgi:hypothetical protein